MAPEKKIMQLDQTAGGEDCSPPWAAHRNLEGWSAGRQRRRAIKCRDPESNRVPSDLRSDFLPTDVSRLRLENDPRFCASAAPGIEPGTSRTQTENHAARQSSGGARWRRKDNVAPKAQHKGCKADAQIPYESDGLMGYKSRVRTPQGICVSRAAGCSSRAHGRLWADAWTHWGLNPGPPAC